MLAAVFAFDYRFHGVYHLVYFLVLIFVGGSLLAELIVASFDMTD